jgi:hypothetical protein
MEEERKEGGKKRKQGRKEIRREGRRANFG